MTKEIILPHGLVTVVDDGDFDYCMEFRWHAVRKPGRSSGYAMTNRFVDGRRTTALLHNLITGWSMVDHVNGDGLDNRRDNLRAATYAQNSQNRGPRAGNASGYKGVTARCSPTKPWFVEIRANGRRRYVGIYATAEEAARAYDVAAREHHGDFAWLNFPDDERVR